MSLNAKLRFALHLEATVTPVGEVLDNVLRALQSRVLY